MTTKITQDVVDFAKSVKTSNHYSEIIKLLESNEDWTVEYDGIEEKIEHLFENWDDINERKEIDKTRLLQLLGYLSTGDMIDFLATLEKIDKEFYEKLIDKVNELNENQMPVFSMLFAKRLLVIYRLMVIPKIFSADRLKALETEINKI
jgi:hypothetical protein